MLVRHHSRKKDPGPHTVKLVRIVCGVVQNGPPLQCKPSKSRIWTPRRRESLLHSAPTIKKLFLHHILPEVYKYARASTGIGKRAAENSAKLLIGRPTPF
ncbi:Asparagine--tRNA ligase [Fusarium oxysporum f. sp. albedinis]|nr:Asparagine--tRNA ligase [Fusarium oxysporum f. sp. albedinis]